MTIDLVPVRPDITLLQTLGYGFFAFVLGLLLTPWFISFLRKNRMGKQLRVEAVDGGSASVFQKYHKHKFGTPTMGGLLIWGSILLTILFSRVLSLTGYVDHSLLQRGQVYVPLFILVTMGLLGAFDDYLNIIGAGKKKGLDWIPKLTTLLLISGLAATWFYFKLGYDQISIPFYGPLVLGAWYIPLFMLIIVGTSNAVNVTDGLDGLAAGLLVISFAAFGTVAFTEGLDVLAAFCFVCVGSIAAFLWHNVPPALFFMGDTGSLALGGTLGVIAMMTDNVLILPFIGFIFLVEILSVIIQLTSKKYRGGKKVFKAAPIHHHFEALEWGESKVTMRMWIVGSFMAFLGVVISMFG